MVPKINCKYEINCKYGINCECGINCKYGMRHFGWQLGSFGQMQSGRSLAASELQNTDLAIIVKYRFVKDSHFCAKNFS